MTSIFKPLLKIMGLNHPESGTMFHVICRAQEDYLSIWNHLRYSQECHYGLQSFDVIGEDHLLDLSSLYLEICVADGQAVSGTLNSPGIAARVLHTEG